jgi:ferredoxin
MTDHKLVLDAAHCDGHGICVLRFPERIGLDRWGYAEVDPSPFASGRLLRRARHAAAACPNAALRLAVIQTGPVSVSSDRR